MVELTGKITSIKPDSATGKVRLSFEIDENQISNCLQLRDYDQVSVRVFRYRPKRSSEANRYFWYLCNEIAEKLSAEKVKHTKDDVYQKYIKEFGVYDEEELDVETAKLRRKEWESRGSGWVTEQVDFAADSENVIIRFYYGSSTYNTKQMSRLIDSATQDCEAMDIQVKTQEELKRVLFSWKTNS